METEIEGASHTVLAWQEYGGLINAANSLRRYFGLQLHHDSDADLDAYFNQNKPRCIIALLVDAMGTSVMEQHLSETGFLRAHLLKETTTVFPPTTTAATTSFRTGKSPAENGWLGWNQYFKEVDDNIILFRETAQYGTEQYPGFVGKTLPFQDLTDELNACGVQSDSVWPGWGMRHPSITFPDLLTNTGKLACDEQLHCVYVYWDAFDTLMHQLGPSAKPVGEKLREMEQQIEAFAKGLPEDCTLMIVADHSQIDIRQSDMTQHKDMCACFRHEPALEPRTIAFDIKEDQKENFVQLFEEAYGKDYQLYTHAQVMAEKLFGEGIPHPRMEEFIGDYLAVARTDLQLAYRHKLVTKGDHAGGLKEEAMIPLILYTKK